MAVGSNGAPEPGLYLRWPYTPMYGSYDWDLIEMGGVGLVIVVFTLVTLLLLLMCKSRLRRAWLVVCYSLAAAWVVHWSESMCFARNDHPRHIDAVPELLPHEAHRLWEYQQEGLPCILKGVLNATINLNDWTPAALAQRYGDAEIEVQLGNVEQETTELALIQFDDFLKGIEDEDWIANHTRSNGKMPMFAESDDLFETQPELMVESHRLLYALDLHRMGMLHYNLLFWIGPAGAKTGLHSDIDARNLLFQLHGKKVFGMFPPDQNEYLYISDKYDPGAYLGRVDPFAPDYEQFPKFAQAQALEVDLEAGDVIFVPTRWFHYVRTVEASVSVSVRLYSICESLSMAPSHFLQLLHDAGLYQPGNCVCHDAHDGENLSPY